MRGRRGGPGGPRPQRSSLIAGLLAASATFSLFLIAVLVWGWSVLFAPGPAARQGEATIVSLRSGLGVNAIGQTLKQAGVIRSTDMFRAVVSLTGADRRLRAGEYEVPDRASLSQVVGLLTSGKVVRHFVTLPEGRSSAQLVDILMAEPVLTGTVEIPPEGSLLPETYEVVRGETRQAVIERMQRAARENLAKMWAGRAADLAVRTPEEAVILASIVEKETGLASERPRVAAVFSNRLRLGMRLESDPTIVYGVNGGKPLGRGIRLSELQRETPYNTYLIAGLPPTPITNPGKEAIHAVLHPPRTNELYFVANGEGGHVFARTYEAHLANVTRWRAIERARQGLAPYPAPEPPPGSSADAPAPIEGEATITLQAQGTPVRRPAPATPPAPVPAVADDAP